MKKYLILISVAIIAFVCFSCKEDQMGQYPIDNTVPNPVSNVLVENLPGAIKLTYELPNDLDLLYVKAVYVLDNGQEMEKKTSTFSNEMLIKGFGFSKKRTVKLVSVDRSRNESDAVSVEIEPEDSPIYTILKNIKYETIFGGFSLAWNNPLNEDLIIEVLKQEDTSDEMVNIETIYSSASEVAKNVRGLDSVRTTFGVVIKDIFQNQTDTLFMTLKPYFEERVPPSGFKPLPLSSSFKLFTRSGPQYFGMENAWDGITGVFYNWFYIATGNLIMPYFTFDMGVKTKISRIRIWQRSDYLYALHNPKSFEVYGTNDIAVASDAETENWVENPSWIKLGQFNSYKPSGSTSEVTNEDVAYAIDGEDYEFPLDAPYVRYLRFKILEIWGGSTGFHIEEMAIWGEISNQ